MRFVLHPKVIRKHWCRKYTDHFGFQKRAEAVKYEGKAIYVKNKEGYL